MQRDPSADVGDILQAAAAIRDATAAIDEATYAATRLIRSAVEQAFIIIGEALKVKAQREPFPRDPAGAADDRFPQPAHPRVSERERPCGLGCAREAAHGQSRRWIRPILRTSDWRSV